MDDYQFNSVFRHIQNKGGSIGQQTLHGLLQSDFTPTYHPFRDYFTGLEPWDGKTDYIKQLADKVKTTDQEYFAFCFRKWLVAMVASAVDPKVINHSVLLFKGPQGIGKTTFFANLMPPVLKDYIYSGYLDPQNKDSMVHLSEMLLICLDELETLTKKSEGALKEIITKGEIRIRKAYGRFATSLTRHASFCGAVNNTNILHDKTGSRRFLIHEVKSIDYQSMGDMDKVFSQAYSLYKSGEFRYWFDTEDIKVIQAHNVRFEVHTVEEELLLDSFVPAKPKQHGALKLRSSEILKKLHDGKVPNGSHGASIRLGQALTKHGFESAQNGGSTHWWVEPASSFEATFNRSHDTSPGGSEKPTLTSVKSLRQKE